MTRQEIHGNKLTGWGDRKLPPHKPFEVLFHATIDVPSIMQNGFKTRNQLGTSALGGGPDDVISFTADINIAKAIVDGIYEIIKIANNKMSMQDVLNKTSKEYSPEYINRLKQKGIVSRHPMDEPQRQYDQAKKQNFSYDGGERYFILQAYKSYLISHPKRYDPLFWGVKLDDFMHFDPTKVGILACKVDMSQVKEYLISMEEFRVPPSAIISIKQVPYKSPYI